MIKKLIRKKTLLLNLLQTHRYLSQSNFIKDSDIFDIPIKDRIDAKGNTFAQF